MGRGVSSWILATYWSRAGKKSQLEYIWVQPTSTFLLTKRGGIGKLHELNQNRIFFSPRLAPCRKVVIVREGARSLDDVDSDVLIATFTITAILVARQQAAAGPLRPETQYNLVPFHIPNTAISQVFVKA